jgi:hypothetical protein
MSIGPMPSLVNVAGVPLAQSKGADVERVQQDVAAQQRQTASSVKAENAAGIAAADEDHQAEDRDADGRRLWEEMGPAKHPTAESEPSEPSPLSRDASGQSGNLLDLSV